MIAQYTGDFMLNVIIWGAGGKMGQVLAAMCRNDEHINLIAGIDRFARPEDFNYKVYTDPDECVDAADVIIDFSRPAALEDILNFSKKRGLPIVLATTGYDDSQIAAIDRHAEKLSVFRSYNMSLGINLLSALAEKAEAVLGHAFDVEIIERHHNQKADAPSGTALMLAEAVKSGQKDDMEYVYGRSGKNCKRKNGEIGMHAVRGGTIVGQHDVIFAGYNEVITLSHSAESKEIFASGALAAAKFIVTKKCGKYSMKDIFA